MLNYKIKSYLSIYFLLISQIVLFSFAKAAEDLPFLFPDPVSAVPYEATLTEGGAIALSLNEQSYLLESDFALVPGWANFTSDKTINFVKSQKDGETFIASTETFSVKRVIKRSAEALIVTDTIKNLSSENLPMMYRNKLRPGELNEYRICGYRIYSKRGSGNSSINSTVICMPKSGGSIGLLALSDVFRVHFRGFAAQGYYGIGDDNLVIRPGVEQEMKFAIFLSEKTGYYDQINAMRRFLGVNYIIPSGFAFLAPYPRGVITFDSNYERIGKENTVEEIATWLNNKSADYVSDGALASLKESSHGTAWMKTAKPEIHLPFHDKIRQARKTASLFHYFHCFLDVKSVMPEDFPNDRILTPSGKQADYRNPNLPLYLPLLDNEWGRQQDLRLERLRDEYKLDGIFWDEFAYSATKYHFGEPWDGVSADINPRTHEISQLKTSVALITLPWRLKAVQMLADNDLLLIVNGGGGRTQTMTDFFVKHKFLAFMETGSVTNLNTGHLSTPIGLGDHITERNELDCYRNQVRFLDFGNVYYYYHQQVEPFTHPTLAQYMFPITPVQLGEGYIFGEERIITNRSGYYSFGGKEKASLHFFNSDGYEVERKVETLEKDGKIFYRVELAEFESCAIVKE